MASSGETARHLALKRLALTWARDRGFPIAATEVRVPNSGYRADVAACARRAAGRTAVFECKQGRADLLKDSHAETAARQAADELALRLQRLEELIGTHRPDVRRGEMLFPEFDAVVPGALEHATHRRLTQELALWQRRLLRGTKFSHMVRYRCADVLYLVVEDDIFAPAELPTGWGVLVRRGEELELRRPPVWLDAETAQRQALLEAIALAATRAVQRAAGVPPPEAWSPPHSTSAESS